MVMNENGSFENTIPKTPYQVFDSFLKLTLKFPPSIRNDFMLSLFHEIKYISDNATAVYCLFNILYS